MSNAETVFCYTEMVQAKQRSRSRKERAQIEDPNYWRRLNADSRVTETPWPDAVELIGFEADALEAYRSSLAREGYFQTGPCIPPTQLERLIRCVRRVMDAGHPPTYALLYDDFFVVLASLGELLSGVLGEGFQIVPDEPEVYFIPTADHASGTPPHRDSLRFPGAYDAQGLPTLINIWIPITDASALNSCMHVVPAHLDPGYRAQSHASEDGSGIETADLQSVRALPAPSGSVVGWSTGLLHWGGYSSSRAELPRLSFAMYFQGGQADRFHAATAEVPFHVPFETRLYLIEKVWRDPQGLQAGRYLDWPL